LNIADLPVWTAPLHQSIRHTIVAAVRDRLIPEPTKEAVREHGERRWQRSTLALARIRELGEAVGGWPPPYWTEYLPHRFLSAIRLALPHADLRHTPIETIRLTGARFWLNHLNVRSVRELGEAIGGWPDQPPATIRAMSSSTAARNASSATGPRVSETVRAGQ
jgi:hypothetical protein